MQAVLNDSHERFVVSYEDSGMVQHAPMDGCLDDLPVWVRNLNQKGFIVRSVVKVKDKSENVELYKDGAFTGAFHKLLPAACPDLMKPEHVSQPQLVVTYCQRSPYKDLVARERNRIQLEKDRNALLEKHTEELLAIDEKIKEETRYINLISSGIDTVAVDRALSVIYIRGHYPKAIKDGATVADAVIQDLIGGGTFLRDKYVGVKTYGPGEHGLSHVVVELPYGVDPSSGEITFAIGFMQPFRNKGFVDGDELSDEDVGACIYFLRNIEAIEEALLRF
jgi:hypothetical protein